MLGFRSGPTEGAITSNGDGGGSSGSSVASVAGLDQLLAEDERLSTQRRRVARLEHQLWRGLVHHNLLRSGSPTSRVGWAPSKLMLALGVLSSPTEASKRAYVRRTLSTEVHASLATPRRGGFAYCFVVGVRQYASHGRGHATRAALARESASSGDMELLPEVFDGAKYRLAAKTIFWFLAAHARFPEARFVAKCDMDSFVVVPRTLAMLRIVARREDADAPILVGLNAWTSFERPAYELCACCHSHREVALSHQRGASEGYREVPRQCDHGSATQLDGPFAYGFGSLLVISRAAAACIGGGGVDGGGMKLRAAALRLANGTMGAFASYADEQMVGWFLSHCRGLIGVRLSDRATADIDNERDAARAPPPRHAACLQQLNLTVEQLATGYFHKIGGSPERVWPHALVVHHVLDEVQWNRTWAMSAHWTAVLHDRSRKLSTLSPESSQSELLKREEPLCVYQTERVQLSSL